MSIKQKRKTRVIPLFIAMTFEIFDSLVYQELTNAARVAYLLLCRQKQTDFYKQDVICPYTTAQKYMDKRTWHDAISMLVRFRLIEIRQGGGLYRKTNIYRFTSDWKLLDMVNYNRRVNNVPVIKPISPRDAVENVPVG